MRASVRVELDGVTRQFTAMGARARRPEPALAADETLRDLQAASAQRFRRGLTRNADGTVAAKRRKGQPARPMRATGDAERVLTGGRSPLVRFRAANGTLEYGIPGGRHPLFRVRINAAGYTARGGRKVPRRRVVAVTRQVREGVAERVTAYVTDGDR